MAVYLVTSVAIDLRGKRFVGSVSHCFAGSQELILHIGIVTLAATEIATIRIMYNTELGTSTDLHPFRQS